MTEDGAQALLCGVAREAAQNVRSRTGVSEAERLDAYEYLRWLGLDRRYRLSLLEEARAAQSRRPRAQPVAENGRIWRK